MGLHTTYKGHHGNLCGLIRTAKLTGKSYFRVKKRQKDYNFRVVEGWNALGLALALLVVIHCSLLI